MDEHHSSPNTNTTVPVLMHSNVDELELRTELRRSI